MPVTRSVAAKRGSSAQELSPPRAKKRSKRIHDNDAVVDALAPPPTRYFLFKSESESRLQNGHDMKFSIHDLDAEPRSTAHWDGVRNAEACKCMRDMRKGDMAFFYHSNTKKSRPSIVGVVRVVSQPYPDHTAFDKHDPHYDPRSKPHAPRWYMVDVQLVRKFATPITLDQIKAHPKLANMQLVKRPRISVQRVTPEHWHIVQDITT
ncbi:unnamed protein product [Agarophyton chilense]